MKKFLFLLAVSIIMFTLLVPSIAAQDTPTTPSGIPISEMENFIDNYAAEFIGVKTEGAVVAVFKNNEIIFNKAYGYAIQDETKANLDSVFEWGSATKLLVWTSVMQLAEQGKIDLNKDIREYLPNNFLKKIKFNAPITMYNLMHHNAGWEDRMVNLFYSNPDIVPNLEGCLLSYEPAQVYRPGEITAYSNFGVALAAYIVERVTGQIFYEYVWENIFNPLDMKDTAIHPLQKDNPSVAERRNQIKGYNPGKQKPALSPIERIYIGLYPAGSVIGTSEDAIKFLSALMPSEGETSLLFNDNRTLNEMLTNSYSLRDEFSGFAHGFIENYYAVRTLGHGGNTSAFSSLFTFSPEERFALVVMTNQAQETAMCYMLTKALFGEYEPPEYSGELPNAKDFAGLYYMARKSEKGFSKLLSSLSVFPVKAVDENTIDVAGAKFVQIKPYIFKNLGGFEFLDIVNFIAFETKDGQVTRASITLFDILPTGIGRLIAVFGSVILIVLCALYILPAIIISIIGAVKNKKRNIPSNIIKKLNIGLYLAMTAAVINNMILVLQMANFAAYSSLLVHFIINIIYMIITPVGIGFIIANWKKETSKKSRVFVIFSIVLSFVFAFLLLVWEFWF